MTLHTKNPTAGGAAGLENASLPGGIDCHSNAPKTAPAQENLLLQAIKALSAEEIRADTLENISVDLAASHWSTGALFLNLTAKHAKAGDYCSAERTRRQAREEFNAANDVWRQFQETRATKAVSIYAAEGFR